MKVECPRCHHQWTISSRRKQDQSRLLHKLIACYAREQGEDPAWTKVVFKAWYGASVPYPFPDGKPPEWPGAFVEVGPPWMDEVQILYLKSEAAYSRDEESALIDAVLGRCIDVGADLTWMTGG